MSKQYPRLAERLERLSPSQYAAVRGKVDAILSRAESQKSELDAADSLLHHLRLVLDNDEGLYRERCKMVQEHLSARDVCPACEGSNTAGPGLVGENTECPSCENGKRKRSPWRLGDMLKAWATEGIAQLYAMGTDNPSELLRLELLSTALDWIDWEELANDYIYEAQLATA